MYDLVKQGKNIKIIIMIFVIAFSCVFVGDIFYQKLNFEESPINFQKQIFIDNIKLISKSIYKKDGEMYLDFISNNEQTSPTNIDEIENIDLEKLKFNEEVEFKQPIYFQVNTDSKELVNEKGTINLEQYLIRNEPFFDGYLVNGPNYIGNYEEVKNAKYINIFIYPTEINKENFKLDKEFKPIEIIQIPTSFILEYVDVSNFLEEYLLLKQQNVDLYNKEVEYIIRNEFSPNLIKTYYQNSTKNELGSLLEAYKNNVNVDNFDIYFTPIVEYFYQNLTKIMTKIELINLNSFVNITQLFSLIDNKINLNNMFYLNNILASLDGNLDKIIQNLIEQKEKNLSNYEQFKEYVIIKNTLTNEQKLKYLYSISK